LFALVVALRSILRLIFNGKFAKFVAADFTFFNGTLKKLIFLISKKFEHLDNNSSNNNEEPYIVILSTTNVLVFVGYARTYE
jgi:hypothetical protein